MIARPIDDVLREDEARRQHKCPQCGVGFDFERDLTEHLRGGHPKPGESDICATPRCGKRAHHRGRCLGQGFPREATAKRHETKAPAPVPATKTADPKPPVAVVAKRARMFAGRRYRVSFVSEANEVTVEGEFVGAELDDNGGISALLSGDVSIYLAGPETWSVTEL